MTSVIKNPQPACIFCHGYVVAQHLVVSMLHGIMYSQIVMRVRVATAPTKAFNPFTPSPLSHFSTVKPQAFFCAENWRKIFFFGIALAMKLFMLSSSIFFFFFFWSKIEFVPRTKKRSQKASQMGDIARNV